MKSEKIKKTIKEAYGKIAKDDSDSGCGCGCGTGADADNFAQSLGYTKKELAAIPDGANLALSCGNPMALAQLKEGETVLDLGSGGGFDCFLAANKVGETGYVIGIDMTPEMIERATENADKNGIKNVEFRLGEIEALPVDDSSIDAILSNCVINLSADKKKVFAEAYRVLKPGGRISISDIVLKKELPDKIKDSITSYIGCVSGAVHIDEYTRLVKDAGFDDVKVTEKAGFSEAEIPESENPIAKEVSCCMDKSDSIRDYIMSVYVEAKKG